MRREDHPLSEAGSRLRMILAHSGLRRQEKRLSMKNFKAGKLIQGTLQHKNPISVFFFSFFFREKSTNISTGYSGSMCACSLLFSKESFSALRY